MVMKGPEYLKARWVPADLSNYRQAARDTYERILIHATDGHANPGPVAAMWQEPHHGSSAHFVVGQDGSVVQAVSLRNVAFHAHLANRTSVGIEHCCRTPGELGPDDKGLAPSEAMLDAGARLVAWLCHRANILVCRQTILGHAEADPQTTHRGCPTSAGIDLDAYVDRVMKAYNF